MKLPLSAARERRIRIVRCQLALLRIMLGKPERRVSINDLDYEPRRTFTDGGKWRGSIPRGLARKRLIMKQGYRESCRFARHGGQVAEWVAAVPDIDLINYCGELERLLAALTAV
jgi:hypothetical protein